MAENSKQSNQKDEDQTDNIPVTTTYPAVSDEPARGAKVVLLVLACLGVGFFGGWFGGDSRDNAATLKTNTAAQKQYISSESDLIANIAKNVGQSVVSVDVTGNAISQDIFGFSRSTQQESAGTGFIVSANGVIATNRHVVAAGTTDVSVTLADGTKYDNVEVIGRTSDNDNLDLAYLKIKDTKGKTLVPVTIGDSSKMRVGDKVVAIGNALGQFQNSVTTGILSGYGRDLVAGDETGDSTESLSNLFQTDAAINPGNSGGPLVNINGEVIGMNTAIAGGTTQNIGFAIPSNEFKSLTAGVIKDGKLVKPYLGVRYVSITDDYAYQYNLNVKRGAYIAPSEDGQPAIVPGSPAEKAGLKEKDIITKVNNMNVDDKTNLSSILTQYKVGDTVSLGVLRDGKQQTIKVTLAAAP